MAKNNRNTSQTKNSPEVRARTRSQTRQVEKNSDTDVEDLQKKNDQTSDPTADKPTEKVAKIYPPLPSTEDWDDIKSEKKIKPKTFDSFDLEENDAVTDKKSAINWMRYLLCIIGLIVIIFAVYFAKSPSSFNLSTWLKPLNPKPDIWLTAENRIKSEIQPKYENLVPSVGFRVLNVALKGVLKRNNSLDSTFQVPAVILLVGSISNEKVVRCFANDLMNIIADAYQKEVGDIIDASSVTSDDIIKRFNSNFENEKSRSIFMDGIEKLKGNDPLLLHRFTDHDNSIFKDVVIILSAYSAKKLEIGKSAKSGEMDAIANELLERSWIDSMDENNIAAMLSRLTPSVIVFMENQENKFTC